MRLTTASGWSLRSQCHHLLSASPQEITEICISKGTSACTDETLGLIMGSEEQALTRRLRMHVEQLAGTIGERNVPRARALVRRHFLGVLERAAIQFCRAMKFFHGFCS